MLLFSREKACANGSETGAELCVKRAFHSAADVKYTKSGQTPLVRQLLIDANKCLIPIIDRWMVNEDDSGTRYLAVFYVLEQSVLPSVCTELHSENVAGAWKKRLQQLVAVFMQSKRETVVLPDSASFSIFTTETMFWLLTEMQAF